MTLTLLPGTVVHGTSANSNDVKLIINGTLVADAAGAAEILFRGAQDTASNYWEGLVIGSGGAATLRNVRIRNTDNALVIAGTPSKSSRRP